MRLVDMSVALRRQHIIFALNVVLQDLRAPASTMDIARLIAVRLETSGRDEMRLIGRNIVSMAPKLPQARQSDAAFRRYGKEMRPWIWSPKISAAPDAAPKVGAAFAKNVYLLGRGYTRDDEGVWSAGAEEAWAEHAGTPLASVASEHPEWDR